MYGFSPDDSIPLSSPPVAPSDVSLLLTGPDSIPRSLTPVSGSPGYFEVAMTVLPGMTYRLDGTVLSRPIHAVTAVPQDFTIQLPLGDTVIVRPTSSSFFDTVSYRFTGTGVALYELRVPGELIGARPFPIVSDSGVLQFFRSVPVETVAEMLVVAFNQDAAGWLQGVRPVQNITGAIGAFGAGIALRRTLWYQCPC